LGGSGQREHAGRFFGDAVESGLTSGSS
jgi:hypothetical protein